MISSTAFANSVGVEGVVVLEELQQVERRQVARGVVERHVLRARVGRGDPAGLGVGVPVVDRVVVLQARVGARPGGLADLAEQVAGVDGLDDLAGARGARSPNSVPSSTARMNSSVTRTELLAFWYCTEVMSAPPRSMSNPASRRARILSSSLRLGHHELLDVGVVDVEDDHLGRATRGAARLDGARGRVGAAHEGDRARRRAAGGEQLLGGADAGEVEAGAGAALEDEALFLVPVEDRVHRVVDGEDEAGRDLLRRRRCRR